MVRFFHCFQVCYFHDDYKYSSSMQYDVKRQPAQFYDIRVGAKGLYYFSLCQINKRSYIFDPNYDYSTMILVLYDFDNPARPRYVAANMKSRKENWIKAHIERPGRYLLEVRQYIRTFIDSYVISVYGPGNCRVARTTFADLGRPNVNSLLVEALTEFSLRNRDHISKAISNKDMRYSLVDLRNGLGYVLFENSESDYHLKITANLGKSRSIRIVYPGSDTQVTLDLPGPDKKLIIFVSEGLPYSVSVSLSFTTVRRSKRNHQIGAFKKRRQKQSARPKEPAQPAQPARPEQPRQSVHDRNPHASLFNRLISKNAEDICLVFESVIEDPIVIKLGFALDNCYIENYFADKFNFILMPKNFHFINVKRLEADKPFGAKLLAQKVERLV